MIHHSISTDIDEIFSKYVKIYIYSWQFNYVLSN